MHSPQTVIQVIIQAGVGGGTSQGTLNNCILMEHSISVGGAARSTLNMLAIK